MLPPFVDIGKGEFEVLRTHEVVQFLESEEFWLAYIAHVNQWFTDYWVNGNGNGMVGGYH